jgi:hypothetical protein
VLTTAAGEISAAHVDASRAGTETMSMPVTLAPPS